MRRAALPLVLIAALAPASALANGRRPTMVDVHFHPTDHDWILGAATFGNVLSTDDGTTFHWVCEDAACPGEPVNGCDTFDPVYEITTEGIIFNTTVFGVHVSRDGGCTYTPVGGPLADRFSSDLDIGPDGTIWTMTSDGALPNDIYVSTDGGASFQTRTLHLDAGWFDSLRVAPSDPQRVYVSGFLPGQPKPDGGFGDPSTLLFRSEDGGASWQPLPVGDLPVGAKIAIDVVSPTDPDLLFGRVSADPDFGQETLYRSADKGDSWTAVLTLDANPIFPSDPPSLLRIAARADGQTYFAGTARDGLHRSTDFGVTWTPVPDSPRLWCIRERGDGVLFACSENWDNDMLLDPSVRAALLRSIDGLSWTKVLQFEQIDAPLDCPAGTPQRDVCEDERWCALTQVLEIDDPARCPARRDGGPGADAGETTPPDDDCGGCGCSVALGAVIFVVPPGRRRRRRRGSTRRRRRAVDRAARTPRRAGD